MTVSRVDQAVDERLSAGVLATAYAHGPGKDVRVHAASSAPRGPAGRIPLSALADLGTFGATLASVLAEALTPQRWETWNPYNDHRAYPSPRAAYLVDTAVVVDGGRWPVDAVRRALVGSTPPVVTDRVRVELSCHPARLPSGYGALGDALAELELGHLREALVEAAERHHLASAVQAAGLWLWRAERLDRRPPCPLPRRTSGLGPCGMSADPRPLSAGAAHAVADALRAAATARHPALAARVAVHNVSGLADGWYGVGPLSLIRRCAAMDEVQAAFGYPRTLVDVASMNLACVLSADLATAASADPGAYVSVLRAAGGAAQRASTAAAAAGLFCRPVRSVHEPVLEGAAQLAPQHDVIYTLLVGRDRVIDFGYDLT